MAGLASALWEQHKECSGLDALCITCRGTLPERGSHASPHTQTGLSIPAQGEDNA